MATKTWTWNPTTNVVLNAYDDSSFEFALSGSLPVVKGIAIGGASGLPFTQATTSGGNVNINIGPSPAAQASASGLQGNNMRLFAGGADPAATDKAGGYTEILSGATTGAGRSALYLGTPIPQLTGTGANPAIDRYALYSIPVVNAGTNILTVSLASGLGICIRITWQYFCTDGTDVHAFTGITMIAAVNKAGTLTSQVTELAGIQAKAVSAGTVTEAITVSLAASVLTVKFTPTDSLTATVQRLDYEVLTNALSLTLL